MSPRCAKGNVHVTLSTLGYIFLLIYWVLIYSLPTWKQFVVPCLTQKLQNHSQVSQRKHEWFTIKIKFLKKRSFTFCSALKWDHVNFSSTFFTKKTRVLGFLPSLHSCLPFFFPSPALSFFLPSFFVAENTSMRKIRKQDRSCPDFVAYIWSHAVAPELCEGPRWPWLTSDEFMPHEDEVRCYNRGTDIEKKKRGATQWMSKVECIVQSASEVSFL